MTITYLEAPQNPPILDEEWSRLNTDRHWPETWMAVIRDWFLFVERQPDGSWCVGFSDVPTCCDCMMRGIKYATRELAQDAAAECARSPV